jgi:hypothetical protein
MKVFRKVAEPSFYEAVGHDGPHPFTPAVVNTFPVNIAVKPGDVLGFNAVGSTACRFDGDSNLLNGPADLPDGQQASFAGVQSGRLNVSATVTPTNSFTVGALARNRKRGTATLTIDLPNPGNLTITGPGVSAAGGRAETATAVAAGRTKVTIRARGKKRRTLNETGKVKLRATVSYTPSGGEPNTQPLKVKLRKRHL